MEILNIKASKHTPEIRYDQEENTLIFSGSSLPENVHDFYKPVISWLDEYENNIENINVPLKVSVKFAYYNSGSMRYISDIFTKIARFGKKGITPIVSWYYEKEDELLREAGEDLADITGLDFEFIVS